MAQGLPSMYVCMSPFRYRTKYLNSKKYNRRRFFFDRLKRR